MNTVFYGVVEEEKNVILIDKKFAKKRLIHFRKVFLLKKNAVRKLIIICNIGKVKEMSQST